MRIADAARDLGISADLIRKLERRGEIKLPRDRNGHRRLSLSDLDRLRAIVYPRSHPVGGPAPDDDHLLTQPRYRRTGADR
jgi:excisionase family DNA binding protein